MQRGDVHQEKGERLRVLGTAPRSRIAVVTLPPGRVESCPPDPRDGDGVVYVVEGRVAVTVAGEKRELRAGEVVVVPSGAPHRLRALGSRGATLLHVHEPPAGAPADEEEDGARTVH